VAGLIFEFFLIRRSMAPEAAYWTLMRRLGGERRAGDYGVSSPTGRATPV
jgi:hypothetical protein